MNLKQLAQMASDLPDLKFDYTGAEQFHPELFNRTVTDLPSVIEYVRQLKDRVATQSLMLKDLSDAYTKLRDIILEAELP